VRKSQILNNIFWKWAWPGPNAWVGSNLAQMHGLGWCEQCLPLFTCHVNSGGWQRRRRSRRKKKGRRADLRWLQPLAVLLEATGGETGGGAGGSRWPAMLFFFSLSPLFFLFSSLLLFFFLLSASPLFSLISLLSFLFSLVLFFFPFSRLPPFASSLPLYLYVEKGGEKALPLFGQGIGQGRRGRQLEGGRPPVSIQASGVFGSASFWAKRRKECRWKCRGMQLPSPVFCTSRGRRKHGCRLKRHRFKLFSLYFFFNSACI